MEDKKEKGFVVKDKRFFDESSELPKENEIKEEASSAEAQQEKEEQEPRPSTTEESFFEINFSSFLISLSTTAMYHFGDFADPASGKAEKNLPAAKHTIDILAMLKDKTTGNLDENERKLLESLLYDLRMRYVKEKTGT